MAEQPVIIKYSEVCRTCMSTRDLQPIFSLINEPVNLAKKIMACASIQVSSDDGLPSNICGECFSLVNKAYEFRKKCEEMDSYFQIHNNAVKEGKAETVQTEFYFQTVELKTEPELSLKNEEVGTSSTDICEDTYELNSDDSWKDTRSNHKSKTLKRQLHCKQCDVKFENRNDFKTHQQIHPRVKRVPCTICKKELSSNHIYRHMRVHTKEKSFPCHICGKRFTSGFNLDRHVKTHTGEKPHKCTTCDKAFIQAVTLEAHMRVHTGETPFTCHFCGKAFKQSKLCRSHIQTKHINPPSASSPTPRRRKTEGTVRKKKPVSEANRPFACEVCGRCFTVESALNTHRLQHGEKTFLCSVCGKRFVSKVALNIHSIVHSGKKPHVCGICNKAFAYKSSRNIHLLKHTGEKRYTCHICGKKFLQSAHLTTHLRLHDGTKPFHCSICGKDFSLKGNLTVHMRIHTGEKPYKCESCGKGFYDSSSMRKHYQNHEQKTPIVKSYLETEILQNN